MKPRGLSHAHINQIKVYLSDRDGVASAEEPIMTLPLELLAPIADTTIDLIADEASGAHYEILHLALIAHEDGSITPAILVQPWSEESGLGMLFRGRSPWDSDSS